MQVCFISITIKNSMVSLSYIPTENSYLMSFFSGFESILEGLLGPELLEDLKLFKGKCQFFFFFLLPVCPGIYKYHKDTNDNSVAFA